MAGWPVRDRYTCLRRCHGQFRHSDQQGGVQQYKILEDSIGGVATVKEKCDLKPTGTLINGTVHRVGGGAVVEARIFFSNAPVSVTDVALLTDDQGRFILYAPVPGHYEVACHAEGMDPVTIALDISHGQADAQMGIEMSPVKS